MAINEINFTIASIATIIPALAVMILVLGKYEKQFDEKQLFLTFIFAIIVGAFGMFVSSLIASISSGSGLVFFVVLAVICTITESLLINRKKFFGTISAIFYGTAFGLGFGSIVGTYLSGKTFSQIYPYWWLWLMAALCTIFLHASAGTLSGFGSAQKKKIKFLMLSLVLKIVFYFAITGAIIRMDTWLNLAQYVLAISLGASVVLFISLSIKLYPKIQ